MLKHLRTKLKKRTKSPQAGFTVIELIVIMSIFAIMASVSLYNFQSFDDATNVNNLALDIALELKRAQTLGSSSIDASSGEKSAMSVIFEHAAAGLFEPTMEVVREFPTGSIETLGSITSGIDIIDRDSQIVGGDITRICLDDGSGCDDLTSDLAISFRRPFTEPLFTNSMCSTFQLLQDQRSGVSYNSVCQGYSAEITITSTSGRTRTIVVEPTGNIFTQ